MLWRSIFGLWCSFLEFQTLAYKWEGLCCCFDLSPPSVFGGTFELLVTRAFCPDWEFPGSCCLVQRTEASYRRSNQIVRGVRLPARLKSRQESIGLLELQRCWLESPWMGPAEGGAGCYRWSMGGFLFWQAWVTQAFIPCSCPFP